MAEKMDFSEWRKSKWTFQVYIKRNIRASFLRSLNTDGEAQSNALKNGLQVKFISETVKISCLPSP